MLNLSSIMIGTTQKKVMTEFYAKVFEKAPEMEDEGYSGWSVGKTFFMVGEHSEMVGQTKDPGRVMFNLETDKVKEEFERIKGLGAKVVQEPYAMGDAWIGTMADPDGNFFQLVTPWKME